MTSPRRPHPDGMPATVVILLLAGAGLLASAPAVSAQAVNAPAPDALPGLNTLLFSASAGPVPDVVALAATSTGDGVVHVPGAAGAAAFAVATVNVGAPADITAVADTNGVPLPLVIALCPTNPATGLCLSPPAPAATVRIEANATPTFAVFVGGQGVVPFAPATNRIFVRFTDSGGATRGATSVAVRTQ